MNRQNLGNTQIADGIDAHLEDFWIGPWRVEASLNRLVLGDRSVQIEPKIMHVLVVLARNAGRLTSRAEILEEVWDSAYMADDPMTRAISELRKAFQDDPKTPRYIETIHGKGYRLIPGIVTEAAGAAASVAIPASYSRRRWLGLAVGGAAIAALVLVAALLRLQPLPSRSTTSIAGARQIPLTSFQGAELHPALSPDGGRVAFARRMVDEADFDIFVKQRNTEQPLRLTSSPAREDSPAWSPDGTEVAFVRSERGACGIYAVPAIGGPERLLYRCNRWVIGFDWSPDGRELVLAEPLGAAGATGLVLIDLTTGESHGLTQPSGPYALDSSPRFSPDGRLLAFRRKVAEGAWEIFIRDRDDGEIRQVTFDRQDNGGFDWSSDGKSIILSSNRNGIFGLWKIAQSGGSLEWLGFENAYLPSVARSGRGLVFEQRHYELDLWRAPNPHRASDGSARRWANSTQFDLDPQYSPDGQRVAFVSRRSGSYELWVADAEGDNPRQLTFFAKPAPAWSPAVQHPRWSRDGSQILFSARDDDDFDVFTIRSEGGIPRPLTASIADDLSPTWMFEDEWIYFASNRTGSWRIWRVPPEEGTPEQVSDEEILPTIDSLGDDELFYGRPGGGIWQLSVTTGRKERAAESANRANWCLRPEGLYYLADRDLAFLDFGSRQVSTEPLAVEVTPAGGVAVVSTSLSLSPDGEWLLFAGMDHRETDLILIDTEF